MDSLFLLVPLSMLLLLAAVAALRWAIRNGQFVDLERHGQDILFPDRNDQRPARPCREPEP